MDDVQAATERWRIGTFTRRAKAGARRFFQSSDLEVLLPLDTFHAHWKVRVRETRRRTSFHRALKSKAALGSRTAEQIRTLLALQERHCYYCYRSLEGPGGAVNGPGEPAGCHEDHYVSLHHGGSHFISNIALACVGCNSRKSDLHGDDFVREALEQATLVTRRQLLRIHQNRAAHAFRLVVEALVDAGDDCPLVVVPLPALTYWCQCLSDQRLTWRDGAGIK